MKRYREIVFSVTAPEDRNVIWVFPVLKSIDNDLIDANLPVEDFKEPIYKVLIWGADGWENLFHGALTYVRSQVISLIQANAIKIAELDNQINKENGLKDQIQESQNAITTLQGNVTTIQDTLYNEETGLIQKVNTLNTEIYGDGTIENPGLVEKVSRIPDAMIIRGIIENESELPESGMGVGDVYLLAVYDQQQVLSHYEEFVYTADSGWVNLGEVNNLTNYYTKTELRINGIDKSEIGSYQGITYDLLLTPTNYISPSGEELIDKLFSPRSNASNSQYPSIINTATVLSLNYKCYLENIATLTLGNYQVTGKLEMFANNGYTAKISPLPTPSSNMTYYLPNPYTQEQESGTLALDEIADTSHKGLMSNTDKQHLDALYDNIVPSLAHDVSQAIEGNIPIGGIIMWSGNEADIDDAHWAICNGQNGTPDLQGRFILGSGHYTEEGRNFNYEIGPRDDGQVSVKLTAQQSGLPSHTHKVNIQHATGSTGGDTNSLIQRKKTADTNYNSSVPYIDSTEYANGRPALQAHNNMPPYYVLAFIMRIA